MAIPAILSGLSKSLLGGGKSVVSSGVKSSAAKKTIGQRMLTRAGDSGGGQIEGGKVEKSNVSIVRSPKVSIQRFIDKDKVEDVDVKVQDREVDPLQESLDNLAGATRSLKGTAKDQLEVDKQEEKYEKKKRLIGSRAFSAVGGVFTGAINAAGRIAKNIPFLDQIKNFFMNVLIGGIVVFLLENIEKIISAVKELIQKLKEFKEKFDEFMEMLNEKLFTPMMEVGKAIIGPIANILAKFMGVPDYEADENTIMENIREILDKTPIVGDVVKDIENAIDNILGIVNRNEGKEFQRDTSAGGSSQYDTSSGGLLASGGIEQGSAAKEQVSKAGFGESEFLLYRDVIAQIESGGQYNIQGGSGDMYAGRYQMGEDARIDAARLLGETYQGDSEAARRAFRADPEMQERYFAAYTRANHGYLMAGSEEYRNLSNEGKLQVLGYAHNAGAGNAIDWLRSGRSQSFRDGFDTKSSLFSDRIRQAQEQRRSSQPPVYRESGAPSGPVKAGNFFPKADIELGERAGFSQSRGRIHAGRDIAAYSGTPLTVPSVSTVTDVGTDGGYGHYVVFQDSNGMEHLYGHLREPTEYRKGDIVNPGDIIGYVGSTGRSSGPHLHWEISPRMGEVGYKRENVIDPIEAGYDAQVPFTGGSTPAPQVESPAPVNRKVSSSASYETNHHVAVVDIPTPTPSVSGGGGRPSVSSGGDGLNRRQQYDFKQFLYYS